MASLAFDVYGTLIDTHGVTDLLQRYIGEDKALRFSTLWRDKQLEYAFRRSMMNAYEPFHTCTSDALAYCVDVFEVSISPEQHAGLLQRYRNLPVYEDVVGCLDSICGRSGIHAYAFTNGPREDVAGLLDRAAIDHYFKDIVSVDEIKKYKPDPAVYQHFLDRTGSGKTDSWLISGNTFDVIGAATFGMNSVWVRRAAKQRMDPWGGQPKHTIRSLSELGALF